MRPIDADSLKKRLPTFAAVIDDEPTIQAEPRIEVERVRHAPKHFSQCPHCGAVMDAQEVTTMQDNTCV